MRKHPIIAALIVGMWTLVLLSGCQGKEPPPVAYIGPTLTAADLAAKLTDTLFDGIGTGVRV